MTNKENLSDKDNLSESGSFTLEAAIAFPVFLAFLLFLINLINIAGAYVAMDHAVSETTKQIAAQVYPFSGKALEKAQGSSLLREYISFYNRMANTGKFKGMQLTGSDRESGEEKDKTGLIRTFVELIGNINNRPLIIDEKSLLNSVISEVALQQVKETVCDKIEANVPRGVRVKGVKVRSLVLPEPNNSKVVADSLVSKQSKDVELCVEYKVVLPVPFFPVREVSLISKATERAWVD